MFYSFFLCYNLFWFSYFNFNALEDLLDRGWRRSGSFLYKPEMERTCCPSYTIRLRADDFVPSKEQLRVSKRMQRYCYEYILFLSCLLNWLSYFYGITWKTALYHTDEIAFSRGSCRARVDCGLVETTYWMFNELAPLMLPDHSEY